jgi:hypothetical protein
MMFGQRSVSSPFLPHAKPLTSIFRSTTVPPMCISLCTPWVFGPDPRPDGTADFWRKVRFRGMALCGHYDPTTVVDGVAARQRSQIE